MSLIFRSCCSPLVVLSADNDSTCDDIGCHHTCRDVIHVVEVLHLVLLIVHLLHLHLTVGVLVKDWDVRLVKVFVRSLVDVRLFIHRVRNRLLIIVSSARLPTRWLSLLWRWGISVDPLGQLPARHSLAVRLGIHVVDRLSVIFLHHVIWLSLADKTFGEGVLVDVVLIVQLWHREAADSFVRRTLYRFIVCLACSFKGMYVLILDVVDHILLVHGVDGYPNKLRVDCNSLWPVGEVWHMKGMKFRAVALEAHIVLVDRGARALAMSLNDLMSGQDEATGFLRFLRTWRLLHAGLTCEWFHLTRDVTVVC